jgi:Methyltransferase domain
MRLRRRRRRAALPTPDPAAAEAPEPEDLDVEGWLTTLFGDQLADLDAACAGAGAEAFARFRDLDDDLWALLLSRNYESYPNIRALMPDVPEPSLQMNWNGSHGLALLDQSKGFYRYVKSAVAAHGSKPLTESRVLDFGLGWGRLTRFFARDVEPGSLMGVDPTPEILEVCRRSRIPAVLAKSEFLPDSLPFEQLDIAYSFSVFTHISEQAAQTCLDALHAAILPGGLLVLTIRPPGYLELDHRMHGALAELGDPVAAMREPRYVFVPHPIEGGHPQYDGGEMTYGEAVISLPYIRESWGDRFELLDVKVATGDIYQVALTMRRL